MDLNFEVMQGFLNRERYLSHLEKDADIRKQELLLLDRLETLYLQKGNWVKCSHCGTYFNFFSLDNTKSLSRRIRNYSNNNCGCPRGF